MLFPLFAAALRFRLMQAAATCFLAFSALTPLTRAASFSVQNQRLSSTLSFIQETKSDDPQKNVSLLKPGEVVQREMKGGETHLFRITLVMGQYLYVRVNQQGIDVALEVLAPGDQLLTMVDSPNGLHGPESVSLIAQQTGDYTLQVVSGKSMPTGSYEIRIEALREPTPADMERVAANQAFAEGRRLRSQGTPQSRNSAIEKYKEALIRWKDLGDVHEEAYALCNISRTFKASGETEESLNHLNQALALLQGAQDNLGQAYVLNEIGAIYRDLSDPLKALEIYSQALTLRRKEGDQWGEAQALNNMGITYALTGYQQKALGKYNEALLLWRIVRDRYMEAYTLNNYAGSLDELGELTQALGYFEEILNFCQEVKFCQEVGSRDLEILAHNNIGKIYDAWAEPQLALRHYGTALDISRKAENRFREALVLNNLGMLHAGLGDTQSALEYLSQSLELYEKFNDPRGKAVALTNKAYVYALQGDYQETIKHIKTAMPLSEQAKNRPFIAYALASLGMAYVSSGEPRNALTYYRQALDIQVKLGDRRAQAITLNKIGQAYFLLGDLPGAMDSYVQALPHWIAIGDKQGQALSLYGVALVERDRNNLIEARNKIEEAITIIESLRTKLTSQQLRLTYFSTKQDYYALDIDVRMRLFERDHLEADRAAALNASERARARSLLDLLFEARVNIRHGVAPKLVEREHQLELELNAKAESLMRLRSLKRDEDARAVEKSLDTLTKEYDQLQSQIRASSKIYADLRQPQPLSLKEIQQQLLDDNTLLLEYALGDKQSYLWAVTRSSIDSYTLPGRAKIERIAGDLRNSLTAYEPHVPEVSALERLTRLRKSSAQYWQQAAELSRMVLGPVAPKLGARRLVIVADGNLRFIPFEALVEPDTSGSSGVPTPSHSLPRNDAPLPLILKHEIVYEPSISALAMLRAAPRQPAPKAVAVLADPVFDSNDERVLSANRKAVPGAVAQSHSGELSRALRDVGMEGGTGLERLRYTLREADEIISAAPAGAGMKAVSFSASRTTATNPDLGQYGIVHFATHGILDDKHPELSGIVLSLVNEQGQSQDGFLRLHDIYNLNLPVDLVVLSACRTGIGKDVKGEGLIGLTRGFMYAGAARVVASLWKVDDEATAELMSRFYQHMLKEHMSAASALRRAQIELMQAREQWRVPYYWAGFVLQGDWK